MATAKLLPSQVLSILRARQVDECGARRRRATLVELGREYGVSPETIRLIELRKTWKKLTEDEGLCRSK